MKTAICIPVHDRVHSEMAYSLAGVCLHESSENVKVFMAAGCYLPPLRNELLKLTQDFKPTHVLWIDADMMFPADALQRLLAHGKEVVGANVARRRAPNIPTVLKDHQFVYSGKGLEEIHQIATAVLLMEVSVFDKLEAPWFKFQIDERGYSGEDVLMCHETYSKGVRLWVDHDLSRDVWHCAGVHLPVPEMPKGGPNET